MVLRGDDLILDLDRTTIAVGGQDVAVPSRVFATLRVLLENAGRPVSRDEMMAHVWPDAHVVPNSVSQAIRAARQALHGSRAGGRIRAVPGCGYIYDGRVEARKSHAIATPPRWRLLAAAATLIAIAGFTLLTDWPRPRSSAASVARGDAVLLKNGARLIASRRASDLREATVLFGNVIAHNPSNADAFAGLAQAQYLLGFYGLEDSAIAGNRAREAASRAIVLSPDLPRPYLIRASIALDTDWNLTASARDYSRALTLDSQDVLAQHWSAWWCLAAGLLPEARAAMDRAVRLDPFSSATITARATFAYLDGDFESALKDSRRALLIDPQFFRAHLRLGLALLALGRTDPALESLERAHQLAPDVPGTRSALAHAYAATGLPERVRHVFGGIPLPLYDQAIVFAGLGQDRQALDALMKARTRRQLVAGLFVHEPRLARLRNLPGFRRLAGELATATVPSPLLQAPPAPGKTDLFR